MFSLVYSRWYDRLERLLHCAKTAFACLIGVAVGKLFPFQASQWLVITILVVMCAQINVGSVIQKSYMRFLGTLTGSLLAALTLFIFKNDFSANIIVVALSAILFSYIATSQKSFSDAGTLGAVTLTIILIGPNPTLFTAAERFTEISLGILIATLVSQFILPIHARTHIRYNQAETIRQLRGYYFSTLMQDKNKDEEAEYYALDESLAKSLVSQRKLAGEAKRERWGKNRFDGEKFQQALFCEKEIFRSIHFMRHAYAISPQLKNLFFQLKELNDFNAGIYEGLEKAAICFEQNNPEIIVSLPDIQLVKTAVYEALKKIPEDNRMYADTFLFCAGLLVEKLNVLIGVGRNK